MKLYCQAVVKWALTAAFVVWGCVLMVVIFGEDTSDCPLSLFEFFIIKIMGISSAYSTYKAGEWCYKRNLFPTLVNVFIEIGKEDHKEDEYE